MVFPCPPLPSLQSLEGIYHNNWNLMRKWKNTWCSYLPSSFPESCCWKGHKSLAALKQCCYLNIQNKTCWVSCYWKEENVAATHISWNCLSFRLCLTEGVVHAWRDGSRKRGCRPLQALRGMRKDNWNILVLCYPGWCPNWCSPHMALPSPGHAPRDVGALAASHGIKQGQAPC